MTLHEYLNFLKKRVRLKFVHKLGDIWDEALHQAFLYSKTPEELNHEIVRQLSSLLRKKGYKLTELGEKALLNHLKELEKEWREHKVRNFDEIMQDIVKFVKKVHGTGD